MKFLAIDSTPKKIAALKGAVIAPVVAPAPVVGPIVDPVVTLPVEQHATPTIGT